MSNVHNLYLKVFRHTNENKQFQTQKEIDLLVLFLESLTGKSGNQRPLGKPIKVPSGLTID